ncbi:MAG: SAM-dependent chlorinase/fluorinase [Anaerolineaceae bacterium]|nr:SAM-dependent chlorinase/fluorinase [Anaerolineaceae bacterium]
MKLATMLTDFTDADGYPAVMKGVLLSIAPDVTIVDLSHTVAPQDVIQAALLLARCAPYFPAGTVHVCVVDPGVGTQRRGIIAQLGRQYFVGPDNGLMTLIYRKALTAKEPINVYSLENSTYRLDPVSRSFHGRDVFAPAAAHFLNGAPLVSFGAEVSDPVLLQLPEPGKTKFGWEGEIIHIDAFGNLATSIRAEHLARNAKIHIILAGQTISGLLNTFGEGRQGDLVAIIDSEGYLSVCVVDGNAKQILNAHVGDRVQVSFS